MYSGYGKWIIESLGELPRHAGHVILIRHSERPDFRNIPANIWNNVILTQIGEEVATEFGVALATEAHIPSISAHGWGLERCVITAKINAPVPGSSCTHVRWVGHYCHFSVSINYGFEFSVTGMVYDYVKIHTNFLWCPHSQQRQKIKFLWSHTWNDYIDFDSLFCQIYHQE